MGLESDDDAGSVPAGQAGGPEPFTITSGTAWMTCSAQAVHGFPKRDVVALSMDGVALPSQGIPHKGSVRLPHHRGLAV